MRYYVHHESGSIFASLTASPSLEVEEIDRETAEDLARTYGTTVQSCDWRREALEILREAAAEAQRQDGTLAGHERLFHLFDLILQDYRVQHDVPGTRYFHNPSNGLTFSGGPGQAVPTHYCVANGPGSARMEQLTRGDFLKRVGDL